LRSASARLETTSEGGAVRNLSEKLRGSLPQNSRKKDDLHPDFVAKLNIWNTAYSIAAWLNKTQKNDLYIAVRLTTDGTSQSEKIKLTIWRNHERSGASDPHFQSTRDIFGRAFALKAWILPAGENYRLEIAIEPASSGLESSDVVRNTRDRLARFLAETGVAVLPPAKEVPARLLNNSNDTEPEETLLKERISRHV
jgi:hypothetical protein